MEKRCLRHRRHCPTPDLSPRTHAAAGSAHPHRQGDGRAPGLLHHPPLRWNLLPLLLLLRPVVDRRPSAPVYQPHPCGRRQAAGLRRRSQQPATWILYDAQWIKLWAQRTGATAYWAGPIRGAQRVFIFIIFLFRWVTCFLSNYFPSLIFIYFLPLLFFHFSIFPFSFCVFLVEDKNTFLIQWTFSRNT